MRGLDLPQPGQQSLRRLEACPRQSFTKASKIAGGQVVHLQPDASAGKPTCLEEPGQDFHGIVGELPPRPYIPCRELAANRGFLHVYHDGSGLTDGRYERHGVPPPHQWLRGHQEPRYVGKVLR